MLWTRQTYYRSGGHEAVKAEVLEDVRMGQRAKALGAKVALALGDGLISTRMYRSNREIIVGFSKNILAAHGNRPSLLLLTVGLNSLSYTLSWLLGFINPWWFLLAALGLLQRALSCYKTGRNPGFYHQA